MICIFYKYMKYQFQGFGQFTQKFTDNGYMSDHKFTHIELIVFRDRRQFDSN